MTPTQKQTVMQQALTALIHHTEMTRLIERTEQAISALRAALTAHQFTEACTDERMCSPCFSGQGVCESDAAPVDKYALALQRAIEAHCRGEVVAAGVAVLCPHHAGKLNAALTTQPPKEPT